MQSSLQSKKPVDGDKYRMSPISPNIPDQKEFVPKYQSDETSNGKQKENMSKNSVNDKKSAGKQNKLSSNQKSSKNSGMDSNGVNSWLESDEDSVHSGKRNTSLNSKVQVKKLANGITASPESFNHQNQKASNAKRFSPQKNYHDPRQNDRNYGGGGGRRIDQYKLSPREAIEEDIKEHNADMKHNTRVFKYYDDHCKHYKRNVKRQFELREEEFYVKKGEGEENPSQEKTDPVPDKNTHEKNYYDDDLKKKKKKRKKKKFWDCDLDDSS